MRAFMNMGNRFRMTTTARAVVAALAVVATATVASAATPAQTCESGKNGAAGKYASCLLKAQSKFVKGGEVDTAGYDAAVLKCDDKYGTKWQSLETKAEGMCPSTGDEAGMQDFLDACIFAAEDALGGGTLPSDVVTCNDDLATCSGDLGTCSGSLGTCNTDLSTCEGDLAACESETDTCGNGTIELGESCDFGPLPMGPTCSSATAGVKPYGKLACGAGCVFDTSDCFACPGKIVGGYCWWKGPDGLSCANTCASIGMTYDPATATYAGSGGSDANCAAVATAWYNWYPPAPPITVLGAGSTGVGCGDFTFPNFMDGLAYGIYRDFSPTLAEAVNPTVGRFCACQ